MLASNDQTDQLERDLRKAILTGVLSPASKLMSVRSLADQYKISYGRTLRTLKRLEEQGLLVTKHGGGTYVAEQVPTQAQTLVASENHDPCAVIAVPPNYWADPDRIWFVEFLRGFEALMNERNSAMKVMSADAYFNRTESISPQIRTHIVLAPMTPMQRADTASRSNEHTTMVLVAHDPRHADWAMVMDVDGPSGIRQAVNALIERGHERIGFVTWDLATISTDQHWWLDMRTQAFMREAAPLRLPFRVIPVTHQKAGLSREEANAGIEREIETQLQGDARPTALVCANDILAQHAVNVCQRMKIDWPKQLSITGFDDEPWTVTAGLSTLQRPYRELGRLAGELAWQRQRHSLPRCRGSLMLAPQLVIRDSITPVAGTV